MQSMIPTFDIDLASPAATADHARRSAQIDAPRHDNYTTPHPQNSCSLPPRPGRCRHLKARRPT
jgi:hypothetical protein